MAAHSESRPSSPAAPYHSKLDVSFDDDGREAIPPPISHGRPRQSDVAPTQEILEALSSLTEKVKDGVAKESLLDGMKKIAKTMTSKLSGGNRPSDVATARFSMPARDSLSNSLDGYRPERDVTAPISVRPNAMELLWVCGDCGQHYPRARECPENCQGCGAPKQHFYAPIED